MAAPQFLTDFQNSMTQLNNMRGQIEGKLQFNTDFNRTLSEKLNSIRTLVEQLSDKIKALKANITGIQGRVDNNTRAITANESDCKKLQDELQVRETALQNIQRENENLAERVRNGENAKQRIQELEQSQNQRITELEGQLNEARNNTNNQGRQIQSQNQRITELEGQLNECNKQREELTNRIKEGDAAKAELTSSRSKEASFSQENNDMKAEMANLNAQIASLTNNNRIYREQIIEATTALNTAIGYLNQFINSPPTQANTDELNRIVNEITQLINQISLVLDGNSQATPPTGGTSAVIVDLNQPRKGGKKSTKRTAKKRRKHNKYNKQKGGFTYKTNIKRRSVPTSMSTTPMSSARSVSDSARGRKRTSKSTRTRK